MNPNRLRVYQATEPYYCLCASFRILCCYDIVRCVDWVVDMENKPGMENCVGSSNMMCEGFRFWFFVLACSRYDDGDGYMISCRETAKSLSSRGL